MTMDVVGSGDLSDDLSDGLVVNFDRQMSATSTDGGILMTRGPGTTPPTSKVGLKMVESEKNVTYNGCSISSHHYGGTPTKGSTSSKTDGIYLLGGKFELSKDEPLHPEAQVYHGLQYFLTDSRKVAIKLIPSQDNREKELNLHKNLHHSNIAQLIDCNLKIGLIDFTYVVMELCGQNLEEYVTTNQNNPLDFQNCSSYSEHILEGLSYLQNQHIVHRDLRPSNILLTRCGRTAKITDFKFARDLSKGESPATTSRIWEGTSGYRAPELLNPNNPTTGSYPADIFSYGLIVCYMFSKGRHPFGINHYKWAANIIDDVTPNLSIISRSNQSVARRDHLLDLLLGCLKHEPRDRLTVDELQNHPFFTLTTKAIHMSRSCSSLADFRATSLEKNTFGSIKTPTRHGRSVGKPTPTQKCRRNLTGELTAASRLLRKSFSYFESKEVDGHFDELEQLGGYEDLDMALPMTRCGINLNKGREETSTERERALLPSSILPQDVSPEAENLNMDERYPSVLILLCRLAPLITLIGLTVISGPYWV